MRNDKVDKAEHFSAYGNIDKSDIGQYSSKGVPVGKQAKAFGDISVNGRVAVHHKAPETAPQAEQPVLDAKQSVDGRARKIEKSGRAAGFEHAEAFGQRRAEIWRISQGVSARDNCHGAGTHGKR